MSDPSAPQDWGNLRMRRRASPITAGDPAATRFWIGLSVIVVLALASPWYGYWVVTWLMERDAKAALADMRRQAEAADRSAAQAAEASQQAAQRQAWAQRLAAVRVMGASTNSGHPIVIVALGGVAPAQARATICAQSSYWLGGSASGKVVQVQAWRGNEPAVTVGEMSCP